MKKKQNVSKKIEDKEKKAISHFKKKKVVSSEKKEDISSLQQKSKTKKEKATASVKKRKEGKLKVGKKKQEVVLQKPVLKLKLKDGITPQELAQKINQPVAKIITELMKLGIFTSATQKLTDQDAIILVCSELGYEVEFEEVVTVEEKPRTEVVVSQQVIVEVPKKLLEKPPEEIPPNFVKKIPVVTVMGHVDHGKTTLLDTIRNSNVAEKEFGAITQHIGAYKVKTPHGDITFIDTPGHEAFSAIRARGAKVTDIVVIVVAGDEGVMPQTIESINHAKVANVPIIFAINKIDLPQCNVNKVKQQLADMGFVPSEWGGNTEFVEISARNNINIDKLLDTILLQAELMRLYVPVDVAAEAAIIETKLDRKRGRPKLSEG